MKTPEEIKKGLECCTHATCNGCPYAQDGCATNREMIDALDYIQQLEHQIGELTEKVAQLERERDAAVEDAHGICSACIHFNARHNSGDIMSCCKFEECIHGADDFDSEDFWQWRGVEVE